MGCIYRVENCKNHFKIVGQLYFKKEKKKKKNDVAADVAQHECNSIKCYASAADPRDAWETENIINDHFMV